MRKIKKLFNNPGVFFRDYLVKKYPIINSEQLCPEVNELGILSHTSSLEQDYLSFSDNIPVDIVYTWINKNSQWDEEYQFYLSTIDEKNIGRYGHDEARFEDHNELFYSLKSVEKYIPWVRKIFVVTNNLLDLPDYLLLNEKVVVLEHRQIIDAEYLPTFNSHVIEAHLHKIEDLSENFIYFNDDVFVARALAKEHFFQSNNLASLFVSKKNLDEKYDSGIHTPTLLASLHSRNLLKQSFSCHIDRTLVHTYVPLKKSMYELAWALYSFEIKSFLNNKFRGNHDLNMATFLVPWLMYIQSLSSINNEICYYFNIRSPHAKQQYLKLLEKDMEAKPHSICANDFYSQPLTKSSLRYKEELHRFFSKYYKF